MFYFNPQYLLFMAPVIIALLAAQWYVNSIYNKWGKIETISRLTGEQATQRLISIGGLYNVEITQIQGKLTDHYNPRKKVLSLSPGVYQANSVASLASLPMNWGTLFRTKKTIFH